MLITDHTSDTFTVDGDETLTFVTNRRVKFYYSNTSTCTYSEVVSVSYNSVLDKTLATIKDENFLVGPVLVGVKYGIVSSGATGSDPNHIFIDPDSGEEYSIGVRKGRIVLLPF